MSLTPEQYMALSTAAYGKYTNTNKNTTFRDMLGKKDQNIISDSDSSTSIELHASLSDYKLLDFTSTSSGFRAAAFQSPSGEINIDLSSCGESIKRVLIDSTCCITLMFKVKYS